MVETAEEYHMERVMRVTCLRRFCPILTWLLLCWKIGDFFKEIAVGSLQEHNRHVCGRSRLCSTQCVGTERQAREYRPQLFVAARYSKAFFSDDISKSREDLLLSAPSSIGITTTQPPSRMYSLLSASGSPSLFVRYILW